VRHTVINTCIAAIESHDSLHCGSLNWMVWNSIMTPSMLLDVAENATVSEVM